MRLEHLSYDPTVYTTDNKSVGLLTKYRHDFAPMRTRLITGVDIEHSPGSRFEQRITPTKSGKIYTAYTVNETLYDYDVTYQGISPYLQAETSPTEALRITAGVRYDALSYDYDSSLDPLNTGKWRRPADTKLDYRHTSPKLGATYALSKRQNLFAGYSHGFRAPSENQLFRQGSAVNTVDLEPVKADNYQFGLRAHPTDTSHYEVSFYSLSKKNDIINNHICKRTGETARPSDPAHQVKIQVESISGDRVNSRTTHQEFADSSEELVGKAGGLTKGVIAGVRDAAEKLAAPYMKGK